MGLIEVREAKLALPWGAAVSPLPPLQRWRGQERSQEKDRADPVSQAWLGEMATWRNCLALLTFLCWELENADSPFLHLCWRPAEVGVEGGGGGGGRGGERQVRGGRGAVGEGALCPRSTCWEQDPTPGSEV